MKNIFGHYDRSLSDIGSIKDRYYNLRYKLFLECFKPAGYIYRETNSIENYFLIHIVEYIIPKYLNIRTPNQVLYKGTVVSLISYQDIELLDEYNSISLLKRKKIIRIFEETRQQGKPLSYKNIAYLTFSTTNTVSKWINDSVNCGFTMQPNKQPDLLSRRTHIVEMYIEGVILRKYSANTIRINFENDCTVFSEVMWFLCEFLLNCLANLKNNSIAVTILNKLSIEEYQRKQYQNLYFQYKKEVDKRFNDYFESACYADNDIQLLSSTINTVESRLGTVDEISDLINEYIRFYENSIFNLDDNSISLYLKDYSISKHHVYHSADMLKLVNLKIYDSTLSNNYRGVSNKDLVTSTIISLKSQSKKHKVYLTENDISFILGTSRDTIQKHR